MQAHHQVSDYRISYCSIAEGMIIIYHTSVLVGPGRPGFSGKIHLKEKKGRIELKIQCRWSTLADYHVQDREQLAAWHESMEAVKKRMGTSFKEISRSAAEGRFPETAAVDEFVLTSKIFAGAADPEWKDVMDEYMDHLENFVLAVKRRERELMLHEIRDLQNRMKACHREFK